MTRLRSAFDPPSALAVAGALTVSVGAGLYHVGLGLAVAGAFVLAAAFLISRVVE